MRTGRELWSREVSSYAGLDADRGAVFIADEKGWVLAFDLQAGASLWRQEKLRGRGLSTPVLHDQAVVVGDFEGYLHWLARDDGHFIARDRVSRSAILSKPVADAATLYVYSQNGKLAAVRLRAQP